MEPVTLTTERLLLRPLRPGDAGAVLAACQDPDIQRWTGVPSPYLPEHARAFVQKVAPGDWATDTEYVFGAFLAEGGRPGGAGPLVACLGLKVRGPDTLELGFWSVKEHRGRGHVTEAALALCRWGFDALGAARVEWRAGVGNDASRAVADRCGFVHEGVLRQALVSGGVRHDAWIASLLPSDLADRTTTVGAAL
jgi:RimJ/RimL family protein N-acetyltransferase